jgi:hypothetical protein
MALSDVFAAANTLLTGVDAQIGSEFIHAHNAPPAIVWAPTEDEFELGARGSSGHRYPKSMGDRIAGAECHIWTKGGQSDSVTELAAMELLIERIVVALVETVGAANLVLRGGVWQGSDGETLAQYGRGYILRLAIRLPIIEAAADAAETTKTVTNTDDLGGTMVFPNSEVTRTPPP